MDHVQKRRKELYGLPGTPERDRRGGKKVGEDGREWGVVEKWVLDLNGVEAVPAYFLKPKGEGPFPVVVYCHSHGGRYHVGKEEVLVGAPYVSRPWGRIWCGRGTPCWRSTTGRSGAEPPFGGGHVQADAVAGAGDVGMMVYDTLKAIDWLGTRPEVDMGRVAAWGCRWGRRWRSGRRRWTSG